MRLETGEMKHSAAIPVLFILLGLLAIVAFAPKARSEDCPVGAFGCGHAEQHEQYSAWRNKDGGSCCSGTDCRPVRARTTMDGTWQIWIPEWHEWADVPARAMNEPDKFKDGRSHGCTADPNNWRRYSTDPLPIYCFSPTGTKS